MLKHINIILFLFLLAVVHGFCSTAFAETLSAEVAVEAVDIYVGEPVIFQITVSGSEIPAVPDMSGLKDFTVTYQGGQENSSTSISIINGRMTKDIRRGYIFSYQLVPRHEGNLVIPAIAINAEGQTVHTRPVTVRVKKPIEIDSDDIKLRLSLSKNSCYMGEPITLTVTWYLASDVKGPALVLPFLERDDLFHFIDPEVDTSTGAQFYRLPVGDSTVIAEKGRGTLAGRTYTTMTFTKVLIPKQAGEIELGPATVSCDVLTGYRRQRIPSSNRLFSDFFDDDFFSTRKGIYQKCVVPSNTITLRVQSLPSEGRPPNFAGHIGQYKLRAHAEPTDVNVGDPITLTLELTGPEYLEYVKLPPLDEQPNLIHDFKIPHEMAAGKINGRTKEFTQTLRALRPDVKGIAPIELPYFDTATGSYQIAKTAPIPINVKATKVITALDAEGTAEPVSPSSEVESLSKGIAYNYEDLSVIENQLHDPVSWLKSTVGMLLIITPPFFYIVLLSGISLANRKKADPAATRAKRAGPKLIKALKIIRHSNTPERAGHAVLEAFRSYLGDKLCMAPGALTFKDVNTPLAARDVDQKTLDDLEHLFQQYEAERYAGKTENNNASQIIEQARIIAKKFEKKL